MTDRDLQMVIGWMGEQVNSLCDSFETGEREYGKRYLARLWK
jgi:hypothetical protein